jgi:hypothetical protein
MTLPPREGVSQFPKPRNLARLHERFAFIKDCPTEIPVEQVKRT